MSFAFKKTYQIGLERSTNGACGISIFFPLTDLKINLYTEL